MAKNAIVLSLFFSLSIFVSSCQKDAVEAEDDNELITTVKLNFTAGGTTQTFTFSDPDGDGGKAPVKFETIALKPNTTYAMTIELLDESKTPAANTSNEVSKERDEHLFIYTPAPVSLLTYTYGDKDSRNFNFGLMGSIKTGAAATGKLKVQLRHQPLVSGKAVKDGTVTPGSDDINLDFNLTIQ